ncbi:MAG: wax ester/triacylglycerol synthase family O-acyltransferase [Frankiales bacterium]|nr:wax ester/triacylglycerol synthase family O-acyltransferase [Frankiales bacterium]
MQQLTGLDAAFLAMETGAVYGHIGSVCVLDPSSATEPLTLERLTRVIESRLHLIPPFRRRLVGVPLGLDQPYWIEDPDFDIEYHVRELALPAPGDDRQLSEQTGRLHARHLDRRRPLWELYLIHGLSGGRTAVYTKVHHAAIDGVSGNDILGALLDTSPEGRELGEVPSWACDPQPSQLGMLARSAVSLGGHPLRAARMTYGLLRSAPRLAGSVPRPHLPVVDRLLGRDAHVVLPGGAGAGLRAPATPFNKPVGPHRRWAFRSLPFADVKAVKAALGVTVNDVVMGLCAGALRRWLDEHGALTDQPLVSAVPVSVRTDEQKGTGGNRVSMMMAALPTHLSDPAERMRASHEAMKAAKDQHGALPADLLADVAQFAMPALAGQAARLSARLRLLERVNPFNLIISNVPGPNVPLYYAGARLTAYYPLSAVTDGQGLNITVMSYGGQLHFGLIADRDLVPDLDRMAGYLVDELHSVHRAVVPDAGPALEGLEPAATKQEAATSA